MHKAAFKASASVNYMYAVTLFYSVDHSSQILFFIGL